MITLTCFNDLRNLQHAYIHKLRILLLHHLLLIANQVYSENATRHHTYMYSLASTPELTLAMRSRNNVRKLFSCIQKIQIFRNAYKN